MYRPELHVWTGSSLQPAVYSYQTRRTGSQQPSCRVADHCAAPGF